MQSFFAGYIVLDHLAKPVIGGPGGVDAQWEGSIRALAEREQVACKLSGMVTEVIPALDDWDPDLLGPWFDVVLEAFGPERILFGSDWPVCLLRGEYADGMQCVEFCIRWWQSENFESPIKLLGRSAPETLGGTSLIPDGGESFAHRPRRRFRSQSPIFPSPAPPLTHIPRSLIVET